MPEGDSAEEFVMRFVMPFTGSRGDVQPGLVVAVELSARGHDVVFGAPPNLVPFAERAVATSESVRVVPFGPDTQALLESDLVRIGIKSRNPRTRMAALAELANFGWDDMAGQVVSMGEGADAVIAGTLGQELSFNYAQSQAIPFIALHYCPIRSNGSMSVLPGRTLPGVVNRATWHLLEAMRWRSMKTRENAQRRSLGLAAATSPLPERIRAYGGIELQAYDSAFFPGLSSEWNDDRQFVGFLESNSATKAFGVDVSQGSPLRSWIDAGPPPVYVGFGSMPVKDPGRLVAMIDEVCAAEGFRAVVSAGWSALRESIEPGHPVAVVGSVDHSSIFPLCRGAVHHGGAGTTAASIRAGLPTMVCWFSADQPFWGAAVTRTGAGCATKFTSLTPKSLSAGLHRLSLPETRTRAGELARSMTTPADAIEATTSRIESAVHQKR